MTDRLKVAQYIRGLKLLIFDHEQIIVKDGATGDVIVNLVASPSGYNLIFHAKGYTEKEAISLAVLMLIQDINTNDFLATQE